MLDGELHRATGGLHFEAVQAHPGRDFLRELFEILMEHGDGFPQAAGENETKVFAGEPETSDNRLDRPRELTHGVVDDRLRGFVSVIGSSLDERSERGNLGARELLINTVNERFRIRDPQLLEHGRFEQRRLRPAVVGAHDALKRS